MLVAYHGHADVAELLLKHGANINDKANNGRTALTYAGDAHNVEVINLLRRYGAK